jgi:MerR family transcriptional regulator, copper efflux regulator
VATYQISELAERAGLPRTTLRFYEQAGLLTAPRSANGYRRYGEDALDRLGLIRAGKQLGLPLAQIRDLLRVRDDGACTDVRSRLRPMLADRIALARERAASLADSITRLEQALAATGPAPGPGPCDPVCGCLTSPAAPSQPHQQLTPHQPQPQEPAAAIACTLTGDDQDHRLGEWHCLFARAIAREPIGDGVRVVLPAALAGPAAVLAAAEQRCCPFFRFTLVLDGGMVQLTVQAPAGAATFLAILTDEPGPPASLYRVTATGTRRGTR